MIKEIIYQDEEPVEGWQVTVRRASPVEISVANSRGEQLPSVGDELVKVEVRQV